MGTKRVGLARTQALLEGLKRSLALGTTQISCGTVTASNGLTATAGGVTATAGDIQADDGNIVLGGATNTFNANIQSVTQATSITTTVTINGSCGIITMHATAIAADENIEFTVTNSVAKTTSVILLSMQDEHTTDDSQLVCASHTHGNGSFKVTVANTDSSQASSATAVKIHFLIINTSA